MNSPEIRGLHPLLFFYFIINLQVASYYFFLNAPHYAKFALPVFTAINMSLAWQRTNVLNLTAKTLWKTLFLSPSDM